MDYCPVYGPTKMLKLKHLMNLNLYNRQKQGNEPYKTNICVVDNAYIHVIYMPFIMHLSRSMCAVPIVKAWFVDAYGCLRCMGYNNHIIIGNHNGKHISVLFICVGLFTMNGLMTR